MEHGTPDPLSTVDRGTLHRLGEQIVELSAHLDAATSRLLDLIRDFDAREGWNTGFRSCAHWLSWRVGLDMGAARERVRVARALGTLPRIARALAAAEISYAKARAITRVATPETEERLLAIARAGTAEHVERIVRGWRRVDRIAEARETVLWHASRSLRVQYDDDGMVVIRGRFTPEVGSLVVKALDAARETLYPLARPTPVVADDVAEDVPAGTSPSDERPTFEQQQADALALLAETALHHDLDPGAPGERYQVVVHVDASVLQDEEAAGQSILEDGQRVPAETSRRLACDASRIMMREDDAGHLVEIGARTRTIPPALRRALQHRDHGCRFPGCTIRYGDGHHIRHWANGGPTTLSNLAMLCRRHHRAVHEEGFQIVRRDDGTLEFRWPNGEPFLEVPSTAALARDPVDGLRAAHTAIGLQLDAWTLTQSWAGERIDVGWAIDVLHPLATAAATAKSPSSSEDEFWASLDLSQ